LNRNESSVSLKSVLERKKLEGREAKGPLKYRRDHGFDCGLGVAVIIMAHRRVFDVSKTKKI
jgi:hypothetical protein